MCAGSRAGGGNAHHLVNRTMNDVVYLEIGDRNPGDTVIYPDDDIGRALMPDGSRRFVRVLDAPAQRLVYTCLAWANSDPIEISGC